MREGIGRVSHGGETKKSRQKGGVGVGGEGDWHANQEGDPEVETAIE